MVKLHKELFTHFFYWLFKTKNSGLKKKDWEDPRDFDCGVFGWGKTYQGKYNYVLIPTLRVIDQQTYNICQWCATVTCKEVDEKIELSERSIVSKGFQMGLLSGNGYSNLDAGDKVLKTWGIVELTHFDNNYCNGEFNAFVIKDIDKYKSDAAVHKIGSHWNVSKRSDILKLLDDGKMLKTAITWWTGFNRGGGFDKVGYLMIKFVGWLIGGHAFACKGYIKNFKGVDAKNRIIFGSGGRNVYVFQNSYSALWGKTIIDDAGETHCGLFFADMDFFDKNGWSFKATLDTPLDVAHFINDYNNKNVKCADESAIYYIQNGTKRKYLTPSALAKSGNDPLTVDKSVLDLIPLGPAII